MIPAIRDGIYSINGFHPENQSRRVIAVHPFLLGYENILYPPNYLGLLNELFAKHEGPLITFEECCRMDDTIAYIKNLGRNRDSYFLFSKNHDADPLESCWYKIFRFLREFNNSGSIDLMGGYAWNDANPNNRGCLGYTQHILTEEGGFEANIIQKLTFK
jgi:hypothetical protein